MIQEALLKRNSGTKLEIHFTPLSHCCINTTKPSPVGPQSPAGPLSPGTPGQPTESPLSPEIPDKLHSIFDSYLNESTVL